MSRGRFSVEAVFKAVDRVTAPVKRMQNSMGKMTRKVGRNLDTMNRKMNTFGRQLKRVGVGVAIMGALGIGAFTNVAQAGIKFEQAIANVGAVSLQTREDIAALEAMARQLGRTTVFTATESANAMEILARTGFSNAQIIKATEPILLAASAGQLGIAETANIVVKALKGMNLEIDQAGRVADVLALASTKTNSTMASLGESLSKVALVAETAGFSVEDTVAAIALLQDVGLDPAVAGTAFKTMIGKITNPPDSIAAAMDLMGQSFRTAEGNFVTFEQLLDNLSSAANKVGGNFDRVGFLIDMVGMRGQLAANALSKLNDAGRVGGLSSLLDDALGTSRAIADLRLDTVGGDLTLFASAIDSVKISMFDLSSGPLRDTIQQMTEWVRINEDLIAQNVGAFIGKIFENRMAILDKAKAWLEVAKVVLGLIVIFKAFSAVLTLVNLIMVSSPLGLVITAVALLAGWITFLIVKAGGFKNAWANVVAWFATAWENVSTAISDALTHFLRFNEITSTLGDLFGFGDRDSERGDDSALAAEGDTGGGGGSRRTRPPVPFDTILSKKELETRLTHEIIITDETGRAKVASGFLSPGVKFQPSGDF